MAFYDRSLDLYNSMSNDLNLNVMFSERGHLTLAHTDSALRTMNWRAEVNKLQGINSSVITPAEIKKLTPSLDVSADTRYPVLGALYHPPGGTIRHDAVVWGYARGADAYGVDLHQKTEVLDILVEGGSGPEGKGPGGKVTGVRTSKGDIHAIVVNCTAGWASQLSNMAGVTLPIDPPAAGGRHRTGEDLPADRGRVRLAARLRQPDRSRRTRLRRLGRPGRHVQHGRHTRIH